MYRLIMDISSLVNFIGCYGFFARGFIGPDSHSITNFFNDTKIIRIIDCLTPPMSSFNIDP